MDKLLQVVTPFLIAVFVKPAETILYILLFVAADWVLGILASAKRKEHFEWKKMLDSFIKFIVYVIIIFLCAAIELKWLPDFPCVKTGMSAIAFRELSSVDRHILTLTGKRFFQHIIKLVNPNNKK